MNFCVRPYLTLVSSTQRDVSDEREEHRNITQCNITVHI